MSNLLLILIAYSPIIPIVAAQLIWRKRKKVKTEETLSKNYLETEIIEQKDRVLSEEPKHGEFDSLHTRLVELMEKEKLYYNPDIRLGDVAQRLFTNKSFLSKAIKETTNRNFCQLVHYFRIKEVMRLFSKDPSQNILDLAFKVGFNSPSTFNIAFGRIAGYTPAEWSRDFRLKVQNGEKGLSKNYSKK